MLKNLMVLILASALVIYFGKDITVALNAIGGFHVAIANYLTQMLAGNQTGRMVAAILALLAIPLTLWVLFAVMGRYLFDKNFPYGLQIVWGVWLILSMLVLLHK